MNWTEKWAVGGVDLSSLVFGRQSGQNADGSQESNARPLHIWTKNCIPGERCIQTDMWEREVNQRSQVEKAILAYFLRS